MGGILEPILPMVIGVAIGTAAGRLMKRARDRGRGQWMTLVGRPPRDLFVKRSANVIANLIHEWVWIGFSVFLLGFALVFIEAENGIYVNGLYVMGVGIAMMLVRAFVTPLLLLKAKLAPQYEAAAEAAVVLKAA
ncbi:MAG: hypothetical protein ACRDKE_09070 [Solirubrobacterales bacterium]